MFLWLAAAGAAPPPGDTHELAKALMELGDERQLDVKALEPMESLVSNLIAAKLSLSDPSTAAKVRSVVHQALEPVSVKAADAMIDAYASNFTSQELGAVLAFMRSPAGEAEKANLPLLRVELGAALTGLSSDPNLEAEATRIYEGASPAKRELIVRILKAQDFEAHTRKGYAALGEVMKAAIKQAASPAQSATPSSPTAEDERAADAYVRLVTAVEKRYYVNHFSETDLSAMAAYLESDAGQAILARMPIVKRAVGKALADALVIAIGSLDKDVCAATPCTAEQRASVADFATAMAARVPSMMGAASQ